MQVTSLRVNICHFVNHLLVRACVASLIYVSDITDSYYKKPAAKLFYGRLCVYILSSYNNHTAFPLSCIDVFFFIFLMLEICFSFYPVVILQKYGCHILDVVEPKRSKDFYNKYHNFLFHLGPRQFCHDLYPYLRYPAKIWGKDRTSGRSLLWDCRE